MSTARKRKHISVELSIVSLQLDGMHFCTATIYRKERLLSTATCADKLLPYISKKSSGGSDMVRACNGHLPADISLCPIVTGIKPSLRFPDNDVFKIQKPYFKDNYALFQVNLYLRARCKKLQAEFTYTNEKLCVYGTFFFP